MTSRSYVWQKMYVAVSCLCKEGSFKERLENATLSALIRLEEEDLDEDLSEDLKFILNWTKNNMVDGKIQKEPDEIERNVLIEKILHVMLRTHEE